MYNIEREIQLITEREDFLAVHEAKGHCLTEHLLSDKELRQKLYKMPRPRTEEDIVMATRFFSEKQALLDIQKTLENRKEEIIEWRKYLLNPYHEIQEILKEPVGEGIVKNADFNHLIPVHGLRIVLVKGDSLGRAFYIKTAYPNCVFQDVDEAYFAMDNWEKQKNSNKKLPT